MPFGYGPGSKLVAIARRLAGDVRLVFVGEGSALELVARTTGVFEEILAVPAADPSVADRFAAARGVLSVMDRDAAIAAARARTPLFVVDSLLWMRPEVPAPLRSAQVYFAQRFPGLDPDLYAPTPRVVGPLVAPRPAARPGREGLVVHLGGSAAPDDRRGLYAAYAHLALRAVVAAGLVERFGSVLLIGGVDALAAVEADARGARVSCASLPPDEARERMAGAAAVLTAPGLTTTLEACSDGTPTWFLPPQNYSQWCILRRLREEGVAPGALHWEDLPGVPHLGERQRPADYDAPVSLTIGLLARDDRVVETLAQRLAGVGEGVQDLVARQTAFVASLGPGGIEEVVSVLRPLATPAAPPERRSPP